MLLLLLLAVSQPSEIRIPKPCAGTGGLGQTPPPLSQDPRKFRLLKGSPLSQAAPLHPVSRGSRP